MRQFRAICLAILACLFFVGFGLAETPALSSISLNSASVIAGSPVQGAVTLNMPAPFDVSTTSLLHWARTRDRCWTSRNAPVTD